MLICSPRFWLASVITEPTYSCGMYRCTVTIGSRIFVDPAGSGIFDGFSTWIDRAVALHDLVDHGRRGRDQVLVELALQPLLHDLHVQQAEEAAAKAEAERLATLPARSCSDESFSLSFSSASRSGSYSLASVG